MAKRKENPTEKSFNNAYACMFIFLMIYLILLNLSFFYIEGKYIGHIYWGNVENPSLIYVWLIKGAYISYMASFIYYYYTYEKILKKKIYFGSITSISNIILIILLPYEFVMYQLFAYLWTINAIYFNITLFTLMKRSQKELRAATSFIIIGSLFMGQFIAFINPVVMRLESTPILIFPILFIIGAFLCMAPTVFKPEFFARDIKYWYLFSIIVIGTMLIGTIYIVIIFDTIEYILIGSIFLIFYTIKCVIAIRFIKREESQDIENGIGVKGIFTKPEKITEEEVSISKEKKICLVCKGKLSRTIHLCPECDVLYCQKCALALIELENMCWACDAPIDESKPVKPFKKEEDIEEIKISEKPKKKPKKKVKEFIK